MADNRVLPVLPTSFTRLVNIDAPIVQAPIGRLATPRIAAAVSNAGALGMLALSWTDPQDVPPAIHELRLVTNRPFGINLILEWPQHDRVQACLDAGRADLLVLSGAIRVRTSRRSTLPVGSSS
jgi:NAD(P)H-dependent flavin oxidoreductase YrpB (nitropropane dioxygenase family)